MGPASGGGPDRYREEVEPTDPRAGHIPGAFRAPWGGNLDGAGRFKGPDELVRRFRDLRVHDGGNGRRNPSSRRELLQNAPGLTAEPRDTAARRIERPDPKEVPIADGDAQGAGQARHNTGHQREHHTGEDVQE